MPLRIGARYPAIMVAKDLRLTIAKAVGLLCGFAMFAAPLPAIARAQAQLVHCGADTCLRLSGHRASPATAVKIGERELVVDGGRAWQATVPLTTARTWPIARGYALNMILTEPGSGVERTERVMLPPGALGSRIELVSLEVNAR